MLCGSGVCDGFFSVYGIMFFSLETYRHLSLSILRAANPTHNQSAHEPTTHDERHDICLSRVSLSRVRALRISRSRLVVQQTLSAKQVNALAHARLGAVCEDGVDRADRATDDDTNGGGEPLFGAQALRRVLDIH